MADTNTNTGTNLADTTAVEQMNVAQLGERMNAITAELQTMHAAQIETNNVTTDHLKVMEDLSTAYVAIQARHTRLEKAAENAQGIISQHKAASAPAGNLATHDTSSKKELFQSFGQLLSKEKAVEEFYKEKFGQRVFNMHYGDVDRQLQYHVAGIIDATKVGASIAPDTSKIVFAPFTSFNVSILDKVNIQMSNTDHVPWFLETASTDGSEYVAEGDEKPLSDMTLTEKEAVLGCIAQMVTFTERTAIFNPTRLAAVVNKAERMLDQKIAKKLFTAELATEGFDGFNEAVIAQTDTLGGGNITSANTVQERILAGLAYLVNTGDTIADAVGMNPVTYYAYYADWLAQTSQNGVGQGPTMGLPYFLQSNIAAGKILMGNFKEYAQVYMYDQLATIIGYKTGDFEKNQRTVRMEKWLSMAIERLTAFTFVTNHA